MVNIFGAGSNQIVIYCDAVNDFTGGFFPLTLENVFTKEVKTLNPEVIVKNTRYIKLCFNLVSSQGQEDLSLGKVYIKAQGTFDYQIGNATNFNTNISLMIGYRIVEKGEAQIELREQEVQYTKFISDNEDLEAFVFLDDDPCPDGNCPPTDCYIPVVGERYGGGLVYEVDTNTRTIFIAGLDEVEGSYDFGGFGLNIPQDMTSGLINTNNNLISVGKKGQAADIIKNRVINGYSDWYLPSMTQFQNARNILGSSFSAVDKIYWSSTQHILTGGGFSNEILNSDAFFNDDISWQDVDRDRTIFTNLTTFSGDINITEWDSYPDEAKFPDSISWALIWNNDPNADLRHNIGGPLEPNTYYTFRAYFLNNGQTGTIYMSFSNNFGLGVEPNLTLFMDSYYAEIQNPSNCVYQLTELEEFNNGIWLRLEVVIKTGASPSGNVVFTQKTADPTNPDFDWFYACPTFRKGNFNRHGTFVAPGKSPVRVIRQYNQNVENPIEGTFSTSLYGYNNADTTFQDINLSYFTPFTHSSNITLHAKNAGCRYLKLSTTTNPPYDMDNPFCIVDLDTGQPVKETTPSFNYVFNNYNANDARWIKTRTIFGKDYGKDIWGEYGSWILGSTATDAAQPTRFHWNLLNRTANEDFVISFYTRPLEDQSTGLLIMNTSETVLGSVLYDPFSNVFTQSGLSYIQSFTSSHNVFGDWSRGIARVKIPSGQTSMRVNFAPFPGGTTNIHTWSGDPTQNYSPAGLVANIIPGVLGRRYLETAVNNNHIIQTFVNGGMGVVSGLTYRYSFYVRSVGGRNIQILFILNATGQVRFNLSTGTVISGSGTITPWIDGWFRVSTTFTATGTGNMRNLVYSIDGDATSFPGSTSSGFDIWGFQLERGASLTPLVDTFASPVTVQRNIEVCGIQIENGLTASDPIYTTGETYLYRNDEFQKWASFNGNPTISVAPEVLSPSGTASTRIHFAPVYSTVQIGIGDTPGNNDYVFSVYVKAGTSSVIPNFTLEFDNGPAGSSTQSSAFTWNGTTPTTSSPTGRVRSEGDGWFQVSHWMRVSNSSSSVEAEIRSTPSVEGNLFFWNPLVEQGRTASILPKVARRPSLFYETPISKDWNRIDMGSLTQIYKLPNTRLTLTPMKTISGSATASGDGVYVFGAQATNQDGWNNLYPIQTFSQSIFIPAANTETATQGYYTAQAFNPVRNKAHFYRKDLYFGIKGFRQENY